MVRPTFEEIYLQLAESLAQRSTCSRLQVGCVLTSTDYQRVLGIGYNGNVAGFDNKCDRVEPGNCGCFPPNVKVTTKSGEKRIQDIIRGDLVLTHRGRYRKVKETLVADKGIRDHVLLYAGHAQNNSYRFISTKDHPLLVKRAFGYEWIRVEDVQIGDQVFRKSSPSKNEPIDEFGRHNGFCEIKVKRKETVTRNSKVYNLEVEEDNSYVCQGLVVHNCIHAEGNALLKADGKKSKIAFITLSPCEMCAKLLAQSNVREVYYREKYRKATPGLLVLDKAGIPHHFLPKGK